MENDSDSDSDSDSSACARRPIAISTEMIWGVPSPLAHRTRAHPVCTCQVLVHLAAPAPPPPPPDGHPARQRPCAVLLVGGERLAIGGGAVGGRGSVILEPAWRRTERTRSPLQDMPFLTSTSYITLQGARVFILVTFSNHQATKHGGHSCPLRPPVCPRMGEWSAAGIRFEPDVRPNRNSVATRLGS